VLLKEILYLLTELLLLYTPMERIFEHRIRQQIEIDDMQFGFMKGNGTTMPFSLEDRCS